MARWNKRGPVPPTVITGLEALDGDAFQAVVEYARQDKLTTAQAASELILVAARCRRNQKRWRDKMKSRAQAEIRALRKAV
jgi:hypothetical protein